MAAWIDGGSYNYPDNNTKMRVNDSGSIDLSIDSDGAVPGNNGVFGAPYSGELFNIVTHSTGTSIKPSMAVQATVNHTNVNSSFVAAGHFSTWHNNGCANVVNSLSGVIVSQKTSVSGVNDSVGVHGRVIKTPESVNHGYGVWAYASRQANAASTTLKGNLQAMEVNVHNAGSRAATVNGITNTYETVTANGNTYYLSNGFGPRDDYNFDTNRPWSCGVHIGHADAQPGETVTKCDAAISVLGESLVGKPMWYNGIVFFSNSITANGAAVNMAAATPLYGLKVGNVAAGGSHIKGSGAVKLTASNCPYTFNTDGVLELAAEAGQLKGLDTGSLKGAGAMRVSGGSSGSTGASAAMSSVTRTTSTVAMNFGWHGFTDGNYFCIYIGAVEVARIKQGKILY